MTIYEQLKDAVEQREYVRKVLSVGGLMEWESKEYSALEIEYTEKILDLKEMIISFESYSQYA